MKKFWNAQTVLAVSVLAVAASGAQAAKPEVNIGDGVNCTQARDGSMEALVCSDPELLALDKNMGEVYRQAVKKAARQKPSTLKAEQRGWVKGRDDCWKSPAQRDCVVEQYRNRTAELQARYRLVSFNGPIRFACNGDTRHELIAYFFDTQPASLIAERGDQQSFMLQQFKAGGQTFVGRNEQMLLRGEKALVRWGYEAPEVSCSRLP